MSQDDPFRELEQFVDQLTGIKPGLGGGSVPVDILDAGDAIEVTADLPGFDSEDIDVQLRDGRRLTIAAEATAESEERDGSYVTRERRHQSVSRSVRLPEPVDDDGTEAAYSNGVLTIRTPKRAAEEGTNIPVS